MRLAIFGGMFDPPHLGHLILAEQSLEKLEVDRMLFIPAGDHPLKPKTFHSEAKHRYEMTKLAIQDNPRFEILDIEINRSGPSYTIDTIEEIYKRYIPEKLYLCIGADNATSFDTWYAPERILQLCDVVVWKRIEDAMPSSPLIDRMTVLDTPLIDISSTQIRARVRERKSIASLVPKDVEEYIVKNELYVV